MADEILNLILNVEGRDKIEALNEIIKKTEDALLQSIRTTGKSSAATRSLADSLAKAHKEYGEIQRLVQGTTTHTKNFQMAATSASHALQDFASANGGVAQQLASVSNNLPAIIVGLGGPMGLAAGLGAVVAVAAPAIPHLVEWVRETGLLGEKAKATGGHLRELEARIKELEDKKILIGVDRLELDQAKKELDDFQRAVETFHATQEGKTTFQKKAGDKVKEAIAESGLEPELNDKLRDRFIKDDLAESGTQAAVIPARNAAKAARKAYEDRVEKKMADSYQFTLQKDAEKKEHEAKESQAKATDELNDVADTKNGKAVGWAGALLEQARSGKDAASQALLAQHLERMAAAEPDAGRKVRYLNTARHIKLASPENIEAEEMNKKGEARTKETTEEMMVDAKGVARLATQANLMGNDPILREAAKKAYEKQAHDRAGQRGEAQAHQDRLFAESGPHLDPSRQKEKAALERRAADPKHRFEEHDKALAGSGLETHAEAMLARFNARGGKVNAEGKLSEKDFGALAKQLQAAIQRGNPRMNAIDAAAHALSIAGEAERGVNDKMLGMTGQVQGQQQRALRVMLGQQKALREMQRRMGVTEAMLFQAEQNGRALNLTARPRIR